MEQAMIRLTRISGPIALTLNCVHMGKDLCVALSGGSRPHIGAVAVGQPYPSHQDPARTSATTSLITLLGHKEDRLARNLADLLARTLDATACVACGIHLDDLSAQDLAAIEAMVEALSKDLLTALAKPQATP